jgi:hypothetical protein
MRFQQFPGQSWQDILPGASEAAIDFVSKTACFESTSRMTAIEVGVGSCGPVLARYTDSVQALKHPLNAELGLLS